MMRGLPAPGIPSYGQGFARCAAESEYPDFWTGLRWLWVPCLGPTGLRVRDIVQGKDWTITGGVPDASSWGVGKWGWGVDFNDVWYFNHSAEDAWFDPGASEHWTILATAHLPTTIVQRAALYRFDRGSGAVHTNYGFLRRGAATGKMQSYLRVDVSTNFDMRTSTTTYNDNQWHVFAQVRRGDDHELWGDGILESSASPALGTWVGTGARKFQLFGAEAVGSMPWEGMVGLLAVWDVSLPFNLLTQLGRQPTLLLEPRRRIFANVAAPPPGNVPAYVHHLRTMQAA